jgi:MFS family permease
MTSKLFFGWKVVGAAFVVALIAWGVGLYGPPVFLKVLHDTHGWPISLISSAITCHFLVGAGTVVFLADLHRRFGVPRVTVAGSLALAVGVVAWANADTIGQLFAAALVSGIGWGISSGAAINAMLAPWFDKKRALALSLAFNGANVGGIVFVPLWTGLIGAVGFPVAALLMGAFIVLVLSFIAVRYLAPTPAHLGLNPDGVRDPAPEAAAPSATAQPRSRRELLADRQFVTLSISFGLGLAAQVGVVAHMVSFLSEPLGTGGAAAALSLTTACAVVGRLAMGTWLRDSGRRMAAAINFLVQASGVALLAAASSPIVLLVGCMLFGFGNGNTSSLPALIAQREFSAADVPRVVALEVAIQQSFFSFGPGLVGVVRDLTGDYAASIVMAAVIQFIGAGVILLGRHASPTHRRLNSRSLE